MKFKGLVDKSYPWFRKFIFLHETGKFYKSSINGLVNNFLWMY